MERLQAFARPLVWLFLTASALTYQGFLPQKAEAFPILTEQAFRVPKDLWGFRLRLNTTVKDAEDRDRIDIVPNVALAYGVSSKLTLGLSFPYVYREVEERLDSVRRTDVVSGPGDLTAFSFYKFYQQDRPFASNQANLFLAAKLPTGETDERGAQDRLLPQPLQPGTGSFDFTFGGIYSQRASLRFAWHANLFYRLNTEGSRDFEAGDKLLYNLAAEYRFIVRPETSFILELNGETAQRSEIDEVKVTDSGGTTLFLTPGLQGVIGRTLLLWEVAAQVPIVQELNGDQLRTDFRLLVGVRFLF